MTDVLRLDDLRITYHTAGGGVPAVQGVDIDRRHGRGRRASPASRAAASPRSPPRSCGCCRRRRRSRARSCSTARTSLDMKPGRLRAVRWTGASIIFQGAMHALNPVKRIGDQIAEAITVHQQAGEKEARVRVGALLEQVGPADAPHAGLPARALRRPEAARDDRDGARVLALARHRRRADDRARRDGAGAGAAPDEGAAARPRPVDDLHHPRPLGARGDLRPARHHVRGQDRRGGTGRDGVPLAAAPVHRGARGGVPRDRRPAVPRQADGPRRRPARPGRRARRAARSTRAARRRSTTARRSMPELYPAGEGRRAACLLVPRRAQPARGPAHEQHRGSLDPAARRTRARGGHRGARPAGHLPGPGRRVRGPSGQEGHAVAGRRRRLVRAASGRGHGARRRVGVRQDHDGPGDHGPAAGRRRRDPLRGQAAAARPEAVPAQGADGLPGPDGHPEPAPDDLRDRRRGPAHPRHRPRTERRARGATRRPGPVASGSAPARAVLPAVPARAVGRPAPARGDRGRARARARGDRRRRAGVEPRRLGARARSCSC